MDCNNILTFVLFGCLLVVVRVTAYFNQTYGGYNFILSSAFTVYVEGKSSLTYAQEWCRSSGYTLATIPNKDVQSNMIQFISSAASSGLITSRTDSIILNGKLYTSLPGTWNWVNGQQINGGVSIQDQMDLSQRYFYGYLKTSDFKIHASTHNSGRPFICEYAGNDCAGGLSLNGRCYKRKENGLTWYSARNECLDGDGDLSSFDSLNDSTFNSTLRSMLLANTSLTEFWVGMQRAEWKWEDTGLAIKYTDWETGSPSNVYDCLYLRLAPGTSEWSWNTYDCSYAYRIICLATNGTTVTPTILTSSTVSTDTPSPISGSDIPTPSLPVQPSSSTSKSSMPSTTASLALPLGLGIGLGVGVILIVAIVIGVIFFKRRQKSNSNSYSGPSSSSDANHRNGLKETVIGGDYDEIRNNGASKGGASNGNANSGVIYAAVQPSGTLLPQTNDAETQEERTVYAQFDITPEP